MAGLENYPLFEKFIWFWVALSIIIFFVLFKITAPYGRHTQKGWGPMINNTLGWAMMELPALLVFAFYFIYPDTQKSTVNWIFFAMWTLHYTNRSLIFPLRQPNKSRQMPFMIVSSAIFFNFVNGYINGFYLGTIAPQYDISWLSDPRFITGAALFLLGMIINWQSDTILFNLRKPGETAYKIPRGGMYRFISAPNYFGEMLEWTGWAIATWSLPGLAFAIWTIANLLPRAISNHKWYKSKFSDYPEERKAVIPFVY